MKNNILQAKTRIYRLRKNWLNIINILEPISKEKNLLPALSYELGYAYCKVKDWNKAKYHLQKAIEGNNSRINWKYRYAISLQNTGERSKYKAVISDIYQSNGEDDRKHYNSGVLLLGFSRPSEAERSFRKAIELNNNNYKYFIGLAISLKNQGLSKSWQEVQALENALKINHSFSEGYYSLGLKHEHLNNYSIAALCYINALYCKIKRKSSLKDYISSLKNNHKNNKSLTEEFNQNNKINGDAENIYNEGMLTLYTSPAESEGKFREAIQKNNKVSYYFTALANSLKQQGESKLWQEHDALESAINLGTSDHQAFFRFGFLKEKMGRYINASQAYTSALTNGMTTSELYYRLGYCLEKLGDIKSSYDAYQNAIMLDDVLNSRRFGIGVLHNKYGHKKLALNELAEKSKDSKDAQLIYKLGMAYDRSYEWSNAKKAYKRAIKLEPNIYEWQYRLGFTYERLYNYNEAAYWYDKAAHGRSRHTPYWFYRLGYALLKNNKFKASCEAFIAIDNQLYPDINTSETIDNDAERILIQAIQMEAASQYDSAIELLHEAILHRHGKAGRFYYRLGCIYYKMGKHELASVNFSKMRVMRDPHGVSDKHYREREDIRRLSDYNKYYYENEIKDNHILYESFHGSSISCNPFAIYLEIIKNPIFCSYKHFFVINDIRSVPEKLLDAKNVYFVHRESDLYLDCLTSSKLLINNSTFPTYFIKKDQQIYINTWHGTPLKTLGRDMKGRFLEHKNFTRNILQSDVLISPNKFTSTILSNSHDVNGIYGGYILESGYPRIDLTLNMSIEEKEKILKNLNINKSKKIVFYAPTWRGTHGNVEFDKNKLINDLQILSLLEDVAIVFRGHSLIEVTLGALNIDNVYLLPKNIDTNEFLACTDILITDYSSILFDFIPTNKPILYYAYDLEDYIQDRGLYLELDSLPGRICHDLTSLVSAIKFETTNNVITSYSSSSEYNLYDDGKAALRVIDKIISLLTCNVNNLQNTLVTKKNKSFLFYSGPFMRNGITTSFINLANNLVKDGHIVTVAVDPGSISNHDERLELISKLGSGVNIIGRVGPMTFNIEERFLHSERNRDYTLENKEMCKLWERSWSMEYIRLFGNAKFDCVVNFEGYSNFWASLFSAQEKLIKVIFQHNDMHGEMSQKYPYLKATFNSYNRYDRVVSVSKETMELNRLNLSRQFNTDASKFIFSENLLNLDTIFTLSQESIDIQDKDIFLGPGLVFITIGRLSIEKDHTKLLHAFRRVVDHSKSAKLIILGDGPLRSDLTRLRSELKLQESVFILGHRSNPYPYLFNSNCFVLSSNHEGQPMTLLEALTLDKDVIATSIAGNNSVLALINESGVDNTIDGLSNGLIDYIDKRKNQIKFNYKEYQNNAIEKFLKITCRN
nr:CDP-glycerol glycerophosphotransferase family protein [Acinetobacter oleivorans]